MALEEGGAPEPAAQDLRVLVGLLRVLAGRNQGDMARAAGVHKSSLSRYESGDTPVERPVLTKLMRVAALPDWSAESFFLPFLAVARRLAAGPSVPAAGEAEGLAVAARASLPSAAAMAGIAEFLADAAATEADETLSATTAAATASAPPAPGPRSARSTAKLAHLWRLFEDFVVRLCDESVRAAHDDASLALTIARMALQGAALAPGVERWRLRLQGYCWAFVANALRVASDLTAAEKALAAAWRLWRAGSAGPNSQLGGWRLLDLEASLRRDRRQFPEALRLLDRAYRSAPAEAHGRILLNRSFTFEQAGDVEAALAVLRQASPHIERAGDPHMRMNLQINLLVLVCHLGRYQEAEGELPALQELTESLANDLDRLRFRWLRARVAAGLGRRDEACSALEEIKREFTRRADGYNAALVSLDLAILYVEDERISEVQTLAQNMLWIFTAQGVRREAIAALTIFCQAVDAGSVTVDLARCTLRDLGRL